MSIADDLSKWYFNTMCGLGDEEHNRKIRQKRENEREIININSEIKLWNIWNCYKSMIKNKSFENSINQKPKKDDETFIKSKKENSISTQKINLNKGN